ncbi:hypothetical protein R3P38DRAFT_2953338 [Favolaschia claudopus]|uniref:CID domain-containing protein n=1 Tax=Favolaschia claudopus TaxID=2862362 RepID=A0AAW0BG36_9AGAR
MAHLSEFETMLKDVVMAKRLSASKMNSLTEIALKSMQDDTQLVSIMYRTHKSLQPAAKVSSLYVFDALARAARSQVVKQGLSGDINSRKGNSATFLLKVEGVLEGLFQDMISVATPEAKVSQIPIGTNHRWPQGLQGNNIAAIYISPGSPRPLVWLDANVSVLAAIFCLYPCLVEVDQSLTFAYRFHQEKSKKILDIWSKGSTFPSSVLVRLKDVVNETEKDKEVKVPADPRSAAFTALPVALSQAAAPATPPIPVMDPQATLLALLTQAANNAAQGNPGQIPTNTTNTPPNASQQFAVLQQLALTANLANIPQPVQPQANFQNAPGSSRSPPPFHRDEPYNNGGPKNSRFDRGNNQEFGRNHDGRNDFRGGFRGRGRGGDGRGWDGRDRYNRDDARSPPRRGARRSRSRSPPPRHQGRRDREVRPYSPPRRPSLASMHTRPEPPPPPPPRAAPEPGKDEFGRDIRPASLSPEPTTATNNSPPLPPAPAAQPPTMVVDTTESVETPSAAALTSKNHVQMSLTPSVDANTSSGAPDAAASAAAVVVSSNKIPSPQSQQQQGMENFSLATFDFTAPSSWEALGKMWQVTNGYVPSTEELMAFVMSGMTGGVAGPTTSQQQQQQQQQMEWAGGGGGSGGHGQHWDDGSGGSQNWRGGRGRGGFSRGRGHGGGLRDGGQSRWQGSTGSMGGTDAVVLGGGDMEEDMTSQMDYTTGSTEKSSGGAGGRMQRVGEKWVFVRDPVTNES